MVAKSVMVEVFTVASFKRDLRIEPSWWDPEVLCKDPRFERTNETGSYFDWSADLTLREFIALHEDFRGSAKVGLYSTGECTQLSELQMKVLDAVIAGALGTVSTVKVCVFEWESGLG